ncbi:hypothetical protein [Acidianus ambivalens]|nr:hypothetical protein [Acidianus ambivalens]
MWIVILFGGILGGFTGSYLMNKMRTVLVKYTIITFVLIKILVGLV